MTTRCGAFLSPPVVWRSLFFPPPGSFFPRDGPIGTYPLWLTSDGALSLLSAPRRMLCYFSCLCAGPRAVCSVLLPCLSAVSMPFLFLGSIVVIAVRCFCAFIVHASHYSICRPMNTAGDHQLRTSPFPPFLSHIRHQSVPPLNADMWTSPQDWSGTEDFAPGSAWSLMQPDSFSSFSLACPPFSFS